MDPRRGGRAATRPAAAGHAEQLMARVIKTVSFDATDALALAAFWAAALGSDVDEDSTADKAFVEAAGWAGRTSGSTGFRKPKMAKNRMHLDLRAAGAAEDEVARLERLGSVAEQRDPQPYGDAGPGGQRVLRRAGSRELGRPAPGRRVTAPYQLVGIGMPSL